MVRIPSDKKHEVTSEGLRVFVEGPSSIALTSPEAQRLVYNYAKESGFREYGMNKFVPDQAQGQDATYSAKGYWLLLPSQWNSKSVRV
mgnify:CR=1 FL=1